MKKITVIIALILIVGNIGYANGLKGKTMNKKPKVDTIQVLAKEPLVPNVTILIPISVLYNNEIISKRYRGYTLYNLENKKVLRVNPTLNEPEKISLKAGEYLVKLDGRKRNIYQIAVSDTRYNEFVIE